ncbi:oxidoreductase, partial [Weissella muntiaci]
MNDLILTQSDGLVKQEGDEKRVSARELYKSLEVKRSYRFSDWFRSNSKMFVKGTDFEGVDVTTPYNQSAPDKLQTLEDYLMTMDMAKHIALMSGTSKGAEIRKYFIEV